MHSPRHHPHYRFHPYRQNYHNMLRSPAAAPPPPTYPMLPISPRPLPMNMRQHSTPQGHQFKCMDVPRNQDLVELQADMLAATPRWATLPTSRPFHRGLYRRICASIVPPRGVNLSLWTSLAIRIWWSYGLKSPMALNIMNSLDHGICQKTSSERAQLLRNSGDLLRQRSEVLRLRSRGNGGGGGRQ
jgi:hypothetical protein